MQEFCYMTKGSLIEASVVMPLKSSARGFLDLISSERNEPKPKLSAVIKAPETTAFQVLGIIETQGLKIRFALTVWETVKGWK